MNLSEFETMLLRFEERFEKKMNVLIDCKVSNKLEELRLDTEQQFANLRSQLTLKTEQANLKSTTEDSVQQDSVSVLPVEILEIIFSNLPPKPLLTCGRVSKSWKQIVDRIRLKIGKERRLLEQNWENDKFTKHKLNGHDVQTFCVKFYDNLIFTGSGDCTIKIWDAETYQCLKVLGKPNVKLSSKTLAMSETELLELMEKNDEIFHFSSVLNIAINDKYLVSSSLDRSCIIWELQDFKPIERLTLPQSDVYGIKNIALYNDYIVCCNDKYIGVWKSSLDNSEQQLKFNLQHRKRDYRIDHICIHDGIIYGKVYAGIRSWNIETGELIETLTLYDVNSFAVNDQYLFFSDEYYTLKAMNLQKYSISILSYQRAFNLSIINNKLFTVDDQNINIWNSNDLNLFKEFKDKDISIPDLDFCVLPIDADSKKVAVLSTHGDVLIFDFTDNLRKKYLKHL